MPYYKDLTDKLHYIENDSFAYLLPSGSVKISDKEYKTLTIENSEKIISRLESAIESHIASVITSMGYVSLERLVVYQNSTNAKWKAEALGAPLWVTAIWETALSIMNDVQSGLREVPTEEELLALMPKLEDFVIY